ncbi:MAG: DHA2 family efflux MFS transporter permease subunit [bacterium]|nr:DHA2 family efflux MFS transporter permease subunit [bacterium]
MTSSIASRAAAGKWVVAATVMLGSFVSVMDISIVNVAMPQMLGTFGVSLDVITWVVVAYNIAEIILVSLTAWFSRLLGRKRFYIYSFLLFTMASMLCGLARSLEMMILARVLQGIGGGGLIPVTQAVLLEAFPEEERGMAMAVYMMGVVVAPAMGPVIGGWLTDTYGWPWIFYINLPIGCLGISMAVIFLQDPPYMQRGLSRLDLLGIALLAIGLTALQIVLERGERENWFDSTWIVITTSIALLALGFLVWHELRVDEPVLNLRVLRNIPFMAGACLGLIFGVTLFGSIFILPLFLQRLQGHEVYDSGIIQMPRMLTMLVLAPIAGRLYNYVDSRLLIGLSIILMMIGYFDMAHFNLEVGGRQMLPSLIIGGVGMALMFTILTTAAMRTVPLPLMTAATSLFTLIRRIGGNLGYALVASQIERRTIFHRARLLDHVTPYDTPTMQVLDGLTERLITEHGLAPGVAANSAVKLLASTVHRHATMMAYNDVFWLMGMLFVVSLPFLIMLGSRQRPSASTSGPPSS